MSVYEHLISTQYSVYFIITTTLYPLALVDQKLIIFLFLVVEAETKSRFITLLETRMEDRIQLLTLVETPRKELILHEIPAGLLYEHVLPYATSTQPILSNDSAVSLVHLCTA